MQQYTLTEYNQLPTIPPPNSTLVRINGDTVTVYAIGDAIPVIESDLSHIKASKINQLYEIAAYKLNNLTSRYSPVEVAGWREKEMQAKAYTISGNEADCPELVAEATASEITLNALVDTVLQNASGLRLQNTAILAERTRLKIAVLAATTEEEFNNVVWSV